MRPQHAPVRVLVQNGEYWMRNIGDLAMLSVTVRRLRARWPDAVLQVMTSAPGLLRAFHADTQPVSDGVLPTALSHSFAALGARLGPSATGPASVGSLRAREELKGLLTGLRSLRSRGDGPTEPVADTPATAVRADVADRAVVANALRGASLVLAMGGGYLNDVDPDQSHRTLDLLGAAVRLGVPAAMVGQGLGPLSDEGLVGRAREILPSVDLIALREDRVGPGLLASLGVPPERVLVTGDDAIELADSVAREELGADLGVCLRVAAYSPVAGRAQAAVGRAVREVAAENHARLVPLVISEHRSEDRRSTLPLTAGYPHVVPVQARFATPVDVARRVGGCRVLVTGAYHLAVFALAQGIPVVGLSSSRYYDDKLLGLHAMFGGQGLEVVRLDASDLQGRITAAAREAWHRAPRLRGSLRDRAAAQIELSDRAFQRVFALVEKKSVR